MRRVKSFCLILGILLISGCNQAKSLPTTSATQPPAAPTTLSSTATGEAPVPAGWAAHTSQQCEYALNFPPEIEAIYQTPYSRTFEFKPANPGEGVPNFIYVSVVPPEIQNIVKQGVYNNGDVYNYDPAETETMLNMQVGESKVVRDVANVGTGFTYERKPDTQIDNQTAQTYENVQPWEFPGGTKEIRYYLSINGCTYLIGGYMDTTGTNQAGAITEDLFHQIIDTVQLMP